jgi:hypothetical protein
MNFELNKSDKGNYGWLDLQRMNLPFTTMNRNYTTDTTYRTDTTYSVEPPNRPSLPAHLRPNVGDDRRTRIS